MPEPSLSDRLIGWAINLPWWAIILATVAVLVVYSMWSSELYRDVTRFLTDDPQLTTDDLYDPVVLDVEREAKFVAIYKGETTDTIGTVTDNLLAEVVDTEDVTHDGFIPTKAIPTYNYWLFPLRTIPQDQIAAIDPPGAEPDDPVTVTYTTDDGAEAVASGILHTRDDAALTLWAGPLTIDRADVVLLQNVEPRLRARPLQRGDTVTVEYTAAGEPQTVKGIFIERTADVVRVIPPMACPQIAEHVQVPTTILFECYNDGETDILLELRQEQVIRQDPAAPESGDQVTVYFDDQFPVVGVLTDENDDSVTIRVEDAATMTVAQRRIIRRQPTTIPCKRDEIPHCEDRSGEVFVIEGEVLAGNLTSLSNTNVSIELPDGETRRVFRRDLEYVYVPTLTVAANEAARDASILPGDAVTIGYPAGTNIATALQILEQMEDIPVSLQYAAGDAQVTLVAYPDVDAVIQAVAEGEVDALLYLASRDQRDDVVQWVRENPDAGVELIDSPRECTRNCAVEIKLNQQEVTGTVVREDAASITIRTSHAEYLDIDRDDIVQTKSKEPGVCALNNLRGCNAGIFLTLTVTFMAFGIALIIGLFVGIMRVSTNPILYALSTLYVEVIRGIPMLVILLYVGFAVAPELRDGITVLDLGWFGSAAPDYQLTLKVDLSDRQKAILGLAFGYGAFIAEIFRAGIQSISRGQMEAARSLGMSYPQAMQHVVLPQAVRVVLPPLGNDFISLLKDSALISILALPDLLFRGRQYIGNTFRAFEVYNTVAILYLAMTLFLSLLVRVIERRTRLPS
jgi:polar amino acid transport system permease protein